MKYFALALLSASQAIHLSDGFPKDFLVQVKSGAEGGEQKFCERGQSATVAYSGKLASNGNVFDSKESFTFDLDTAMVLECWDEGFKQVPIGSKAQINCPASMAYGNCMKPGIPENSDLIFDVELISCDKPDEFSNMSTEELEAQAAKAGMSAD